jgi:hypothetical protein
MPEEAGGEPKAKDGGGPVRVFFESQDQRLGRSDAPWDDLVFVVAALSGPRCRVRGARVLTGEWAGGAVLARSEVDVP